MYWILAVIEAYWLYFLLYWLGLSRFDNYMESRGWQLVCKAEQSKTWKKGIKTFYIRYSRR